MTIYCPRCGQAGCDETVISFVSVWASCARCHLVWRSSLLETVVGYAARRVGLSKSEKIAARYNALHANEELQQPGGSLKPVSVDRVAEWLASQERPTGAPRLAVSPHSADEAAKVEEMFDMLDPVKRSDMSPMPVREIQDDDNEFYACFSEVIEAPVAPSSPTAPSAPVASASAPLSQTPTADTPIDPLSFENVLCELEEPIAVQPAVAEEVVFEDVIEEPVNAPANDQVDQPVYESVNEMAVDAAEDPLTNMEDLYEAFKRLEQQLDTISDSLQTYNPHP